MHRYDSSSWAIGRLKEVADRLILDGDEVAINDAMSVIQDISSDGIKISESMGRGGQLKFLQKKLIFLKFIKETLTLLVPLCWQELLVFIVLFLPQ